MKSKNDNPFRKFFRQPRPPNLVGRDEELTTLLLGISEVTPASYQIACLRGIGKSAILRYLSRPFDLPHHLKQNIHPPFDRSDRLAIVYLDFATGGNQSLTQKLLSGLVEKEDLAPFIPPDWEQSKSTLQTLRRIVSQIAASQVRVVFLLNHFDRMFSEITQQEANQLRPLTNDASFVLATETPLWDLNPPAYASWFLSMVQEINVDPLSNRQARELVEVALEYGRALDRSSVMGTAQTYLQLFELTGYHPPFILRGAAEYWDLFYALPEAAPEFMREIIQDRLAASTYKADFQRYWNMLSQAEKSTLIQLVEGNGNLHVGRLHRLRYRGLVTWDKASFSPFSKLWEEFIRDRAREAEGQPESADRPGVLDERYSPKQRLLRDYFIARPREICPYEALLRAIWNRPESEKNLRLLRETIRRLRPKMETLEGGRIMNHHNRGYEYRPR